MQTIRFKKDVKLEEIIQQRNVQNEKQVIEGILKSMKTKNLKFTSFEKDSVLQFHRKPAKEDTYYSFQGAGRDNSESILLDCNSLSNLTSLVRRGGDSTSEIVNDFTAMKNAIALGLAK